jgi:hypothetical protein
MMTRTAKATATPIDPVQVARPRVPLELMPVIDYLVVLYEAGRARDALRQAYSVRTIEQAYELPHQVGCITP